MIIGDFGISGCLRSGYDRNERAHQRRGPATKEHRQECPKRIATRLLDLVLSACGFRARFFHATKTEMVSAGVNFAFAARADDVARAVLVVAKKRAPAMDALFLVRFGWIEW